MSSLREAFQDVREQQRTFFIGQQTKFQEVEPNRILPKNIPIPEGGVPITSDGQAMDDARKIMSSWDPLTDKRKSRFTYAGMQKILDGEPTTVKQEAECRSLQSWSGINALRNRVANDPYTPIRCGWRYKKGSGLAAVPEVAQGALGTRNGPLNKNAEEDIVNNEIQWIWDPEVAYVKMATDYAASLPPIQTSLNPVATNLKTTIPDLPDVAYCRDQNGFIIVDQNGNPMFPDRITQNCANPTRDSSQIPTEVSAAGTPVLSATIDQTRQIANCMTATTWTPDCFMQAIKNAGCSETGSLYQQISGIENESVWDVGLSMRKAYPEYQKQAGDMKLSGNNFDETGTWNTAFSDVKNLHTMITNADTRLARVAAEDLCIRSGLMEGYNFCKDIPDSSSLEQVDIECMQQEFQEQNGKPAGQAYPYNKELSPALGQNILTWGQYKAAVATLKEQTSSPDPIVQRKAINDFYGVQVATQYFSPMNISGIEVNTGGACKGYGTPSGDGQLRLYNQEECAALGGRYVATNQQCMKFEGGTSFSEDCRYLNAYQPNYLSLWLDSSDGSKIMIDSSYGVRNFGDKSGKGHDILQRVILNRPKYAREGNVPGISFDGIRQYFDIPNALPLIQANYTMFFVEKRGGSKPMNYFLGGTGAGSNQNLIIGYVDQTTIVWSTNDGRDIKVNVQPYNTQGEIIRLWTLVKDGNGRRLYINGTQVGYNNNSSNISSWTYPRLGYADLGGGKTSYYQGKLHDIYVFNAGLDNTSRIKMEGYIAHKWNIQDNLPAGHQYKIAPP